MSGPDDDAGDEGETGLPPLNLIEKEPQAVANLLGQALYEPPTVTSVEDWTRVWLAAGLVVLLSILTLGAGLFVAIDPTKQAAIENFLKLVFTPVVGLVGTVLGFYFGSRTKTDEKISAPARRRS